MRSFFTVMTLVCFLGMSIPGFCSDFHAAGTHGGAAQSLTGSCCPDGGHDHHGDNDGSSPCSDCPCHSAAITATCSYSPSRSISMLSVAEKSSFLPEVHLPKFIPPQNS